MTIRITTRRRREVFSYTFHNHPDNPLLSFLRFEEPKVVRIVIEEVLDEDGRTEGVAEDVEILFEVGVAVGEVGPDLEVFEIFERRVAALGKMDVGIFRYDEPFSVSNSKEKCP